MSRIITNGLFEAEQNPTPFSQCCTFSPTRNRDSLGESVYSSSSSENKSLSSTIRSLEDFEFFNNDSLFSDSDNEEHHECTQDENLANYNSDDTQKNNFKDGKMNDRLTQRKEEKQISRINNDLEANDESRGFSMEKVCPYPETHKVDKQFVSTENDTGVDECDGGKPLPIQEILNSCTIDDNNAVNSVSYNYETFCDCGEQEDDCPSTKPCCEDMQATESVYADRRTSIHFMLTSEYSECGGMSLYSLKHGHFIEVIDEDNKYTSRMSFQHNDRVLGINCQAIQSYEHDIVLEMFRYLLQPSEDESVSVVVERKDEFGNMLVLEIKIKAEVITRGSPAVTITADIIHCKPVKLNIKCVILKNCFDSRIESGGGSNVFIIADEGGLCVRHLKNGDETKSIFKYYIFSGLCMRRGRRAKPIFIAVFQSCVNHKFIMAVNRTKLSLINTRDKLNTSISRITKADPRFFIVWKTGNDQIYCESLFFRGSYWAMKGNALQLAKRTEMEILIRNDSMFDLIAV